MTELFARITTAAVRGLILAYRYSLAAVLGGSCRYAPSCSAYALEAVDRYGGLTGLRLAVGRLLRCHPWGGTGFDPVPDLADRPGQASHPSRRP